MQYKPPLTLHAAADAANDADARHARDAAVARGGAADLLPCLGPDDGFPLQRPGRQAAQAGAAAGSGKGEWQTAGSGDAGPGVAVPVHDAAGPAGNELYSPGWSICQCSSDCIGVAC